MTGTGSWPLPTPSTSSERGEGAFRCWASPTTGTGSWPLPTPSSSSETIGGSGVQRASRAAQPEQESANKLSIRTDQPFSLCVTPSPPCPRWTQWIFTKLFERGLAYRAEVPVNWCPELGTVLANEEVIDGKSERGGYPVVRLPMRQWMLRITAYADRLLEDLEGLDWADSIKEMQRNWIGRSEVRLCAGIPALRAPQLRWWCETRTPVIRPVGTAEEITTHRISRVNTLL